MTGYTGNKTPEGNDKLIFREEKDVRFFARLRIAVVDPEDPLMISPRSLQTIYCRLKKSPFLILRGFQKGLLSAMSSSVNEAKFVK